MKIEGSEQNPNVTQAGARTEDPRLHKGGKAAHGSAAPGSDTVEISSDARLAGRALQAASSRPDVRQDRVQQARQQLDAGQIGNDPNRLASSIIGSLLEG